MSLPRQLLEARRQARLLLLWAVQPFSLPAHPPANRALALNQWAAAAQTLPAPAEPLFQLPALPILSLDPTNRTERAFNGAGIELQVVRTRREAPGRDRHVLLKLAGDLDTRTGVILSRAEIGQIQSDPDRRYLLAEARRLLADSGVLLVLGADPAGEDFLAWWSLLWPALGRPPVCSLDRSPTAWPGDVTVLPVDFETLAAELAAIQPVEPPAETPARYAETARIFISSTWEDLRPEREAVEKALHRMQSAEFSGMEYFGSRPETPREASLIEVDRSDIYVGLFAHRYGSGITEAEYRRARERELPCLIYLKDDEVEVLPAHRERDPEKAAGLVALKQELQQQHIVSFFKTPDQLATQVVTDLHNLLGRV